MKTVNLKEKYHDKHLTPDEVANARNEIRQAISELEDIKYQTGDDHILLKWGTLKSWNLHSKKGKKLLEKYNSLGSSMSAMQQHDTDEQKELICQMIDECDGFIQSDWTGEYFTREKAKEYVMDYKN